MTGDPANPVIDQFGATIGQWAEMLLSYRQKLVDGGIPAEVATDMTVDLDRRVAFLASSAPDLEDDEDADA